VAVVAVAEEVVVCSGCSSLSVRSCELSEMMINTIIGNIAFCFEFAIGIAFNYSVLRNGPIQFSNAIFTKEEEETKNKQRERDLCLINLMREKREERRTQRVFI
jgi:hypothetical protein